MRNRISMIAVSLALLASAPLSAAAEPTRIGLAAEPYPPFASPDASGRWVGWEIDFIDALCAEAKLDCVLTPVAWDGIIPALNTGKIDVIAASMSITDDRSKLIDFSDRYYRSPVRIVGLKAKAMDPAKDGLKGLVLGVQGSTTHEDYARKHFADTVAAIKVYQTQDEAQQDLVAERIDAIQAEAIGLDAFLAADPGKSCCEFKGDVPDDPALLGQGAGLGLRKDDDALRQKLNAAIKAIRTNGTYDKITAKYFSFDIYGE
jgi:polar amino acid transport system substrate-binding protein